MRRWAGDDLLDLQGEPLDILEDYFSQFGNGVIAGCEVNDHTVAPGIVGLNGQDPDGNPVYRIARFDGGQLNPDITDALGFVYLECEVVTRQYGDGQDKAVMHHYKAVLSNSLQQGRPYISFLANNQPLRLKFATQQLLAENLRNHVFKGNNAGNQVLNMFTENGGAGVHLSETPNTPGDGIKAELNAGGKKMGIDSSGLPYLKGYYRYSDNAGGTVNNNDSRLATQRELYRQVYYLQGASMDNWSGQTIPEGTIVDFSVSVWREGCRNARIRVDNNGSSITVIDEGRSYSGFENSSYTGENTTFFYPQYDNYDELYFDDLSDVYTELNNKVAAKIDAFTAESRYLKKNASHKITKTVDSTHGINDLLYDVQKALSTQEYLGGALTIDSTVTILQSVGGYLSDVLAMGFFGGGTLNFQLTSAGKVAKDVNICYNSVRVFWGSPLGLNIPQCDNLKIMYTPHTLVQRFEILQSILIQGGSTVVIGNSVTVGTVISVEAGCTLILKGTGLSLPVINGGGKVIFETGYTGTEPTLASTLEVIDNRAGNGKDTFVRKSAPAFLTEFPVNQEVNIRGNIYAKRVQGQVGDLVNTSGANVLLNLTNTPGLSGLLKATGTMVRSVAGGAKIPIPYADVEEGEQLYVLHNNPVAEINEVVAKFKYSTAEYRDIDVLIYYTK